MIVSTNSLGYKSLPFFKQSEIIYDFTVEFTAKYIDFKSRTKDQMDQAARSGKQNIAEGYLQKSFEGRIKLLGVARGSLEELLNDYLDFLRQRNLPLWDRNSPDSLDCRGKVYKIYKGYNCYKIYNCYMSLILAIDTSCDETSAAVVDGRRVLSNVISSQIAIHKKYGGVYPALAKRAHEERIDFVVAEALRRAKTHELDAIAVTYGPGLAIALEVGIRKAKEIIRNSQFVNSQLKLIAVNHLEGHIYSCLGENSAKFPALCLIVSGGHTELVLMKDHGNYQVLGATLDDACGEALDKAAKILKLGYPGGPVIERLATASQGETLRGSLRGWAFTPPMHDKSNLNFSYSGLKTQLLYLVQKMSEEEFNTSLISLASSFQEACFEQITRKARRAIEIYCPKTIISGGGVIANKTLCKLIRRLGREHKIPTLFPPKKNLITDNAAMIGVAAHFKYLRKEFVEDIEGLDRVPRLSLANVSEFKANKHE